MKQTDGCQRGWKKEGERISQRTYMTCRHRQQCGEGQRGGGDRAGCRQAKGWKMGTSVIVSIVNIKKKNLNAFLPCLEMQGLTGIL